MNINQHPDAATANPRPVVKVTGSVYGWTCDEHAAVVPMMGECPGPAFDARLTRSLAVRTAIAFGDWPHNPYAVVPLPYAGPPNLRLTNVCESGEHHVCNGERVMNAPAHWWACACLCHQCKGDQRRALLVEMAVPRMPACPTVQAALYGDDPCVTPL